MKILTNRVVILFFSIILISIFCHEGNANTTPDEYIKELEKIADNGNTEAQYQLAMRLSEWGGTNDRDYKKSYYWLGKAAEQGHPQAQYQFGRLHAIQRPGLGKMNEEEASKWYLISAQNGEPKAQFAYAMMNEKSLPKEKLLFWLTSAAEQDFAFAQYVISNYYFNGMNNSSRKEPRDFETAYVWLMITANRNDLWNIKKDIEKINLFKENLSHDQLDSANKRIFKLTKLIEKNINEYQEKRVESLCKMHEQMGAEYDECIIVKNKAILDAKNNGQIFYY